MKSCNASYGESQRKKFLNLNKKRRPKFILNVGNAAAPSPLRRVAPSASCSVPGS